MPESEYIQKDIVLLSAAFGRVGKVQHIDDALSGEILPLPSEKYGRKNKIFLDEVRRALNKTFSSPYEEPRIRVQSRVEAIRSQDGKCYLMLMACLKVEAHRSREYEEIEHILRSLFVLAYTEKADELGRKLDDEWQRNIRFLKNEISEKYTSKRKRKVSVNLDPSGLWGLDSTSTIEIAPLPILLDEIPKKAYVRVKKADKVETFYYVVDVCDEDGRSSYHVDARMACPHYDGKMFPVAKMIGQVVPVTLSGLERRNLRLYGFMEVDRERLDTAEYREDFYDLLDDIRSLNSPEETPRA